MPLRKPLPPAREPGPETDYDGTIEDSFPASDPPPGVIKLGPRPEPKPDQPARKRKIA